ncbi:MAG: hypothetical protein LZF62_340153 [Nitrospira sp.]|nr:MAG: hypothetical protein LZF62_340153 [Nitrospira sp.]
MFLGIHQAFLQVKMPVIKKLETGILRAASTQGLYGIGQGLGTRWRLKGERQ